MQKFLTLALPKGTDRARRLIDALGKCEGIAEYLIMVRINPGNEDLVDLLENIKFANVHITQSSREFGLGHSMYLACKDAFAFSDFIVHLPHNVLPTPDCLRYMEYSGQKYRRDQEIFSITAHGEAIHDANCSYSISRRDQFTGWLVGLWKERWELIKNQWHNDPVVYGGLVNQIREHYGMKEIYPVVSRACALTDHEAYAASINTPSSSAGNFRINEHKFRESSPVVTAVMITGMHNARYSLARVAIECFKNQTYPNKELLIVNHGEQSLFDGDERIFELRIKKRKAATVGDLRNTALDHAKGDFVISWDDDDWYHPDRIATQMAAQKDDAAVLLQNRIAFSFENGCGLYLSSPKGSEATILHPRNVDFRYPSLLRRSDTVFARSFKNRIVVKNDPGLYIRFHHGLNLWDANHIMLHLAKPDLKHKLELEENHVNLLRQILPSYSEYHRVNGQMAPDLTPVTSPV